MVDNNKSIRKNCRYECNTPVVGFVTGSLGLGTGVSIPPSTPTLIPLTTVLFKTPGIEIPPSGGITVKEEGDYFISVNASYTPTNATTVLFSIFSPDFSGTASGNNGVATFSELVRLKKGDTISIIVNSPTDTLFFVTALLTVAKTK